MGELQIGHQGATFLPYKTSFCTAFLKRCGRAESLATATYLKTADGVRHRHTPCKGLSIRQFLFLMSVNFHGDHKTATCWLRTWQLSVLEILPELKQCVYVRSTGMGELQIGHQGATFLPYKTSFCTAFLKRCGRAESLATATYLKTADGVRHRHTPCKGLSIRQFLFLVSVNFHGDHKTATCWL